MTHDYLIAWRSSEFLVLLSWQIMTLILKVVFIRLRGHHLLTADCPMDGRHINELIWDRNSSLEYSQYQKSWIKVIGLLKIVITSQIMSASQTSGQPEKHWKIINMYCQIKGLLFLIFFKVNALSNDNPIFSNLQHYSWSFDIPGPLGYGKIEFLPSYYQTDNISWSTYWKYWVLNWRMVMSIQLWV